MRSTREGPWPSWSRQMWMEQQEVVDDTITAAATRLAQRWRPLPLPPSRRAGKGELGNRPLPRGRCLGWAGSAAGRTTQLPS